MEDHTPPSPSSEQVSVRSASALRELEKRAQATLAASRDQASQLEADITRQLDEIAATIQQQTAVEATDATELETARAEIERLKSQVASSQSAWAADKAALEIEHVDLSDKVAHLECLLSDADKTCAGLTEKQVSHDAEHKQLVEQIAVLNSRCGEAELSRQELQAERDALKSQRDEFAEKFARLEAAAGDSDALHAAWAAERMILEAKCDEFSGRIDDLKRLCGSLEAVRDAGQEERAKLEAERNELAAKILQLERVVAETDVERAAIEAERSELANTVATLEARQRVSQDEWRDQLLGFEGRLRQQQTSWNEQRNEWTDARSSLGGERDELQQKFELALVDVQRFRGRVAELEQDLARRPETNQVDSAELVALRAERDALSERVEQLEQHPAAPVDTNTGQELADLQRRFELAVEDVRELKTKNAKLESQLASAGSRPLAASDTGGMDWESQKRRMLAVLEDDGTAQSDPVREKERATIEGTIEMTDAVVAEKDREIAELREQLAAGSAERTTASDEERDRKVNDLVDADDVVAAHRQRIAEMERDLVGKLRAAELEISVERAKLARQKMELEEARAEVEAQRQLYEPNAAPGAPRRRWRTKLGLGGED